MGQKASIEQSIQILPIDGGKRPFDRSTERIAIPPRPRYSPAEARELLDRVQGFFAGQASFEDESFRDREADRW